MRRQRFFWIWNTITLCIVLVLQHVTFFDFEDDGSLVGELFISTIVLSTSVNSLSFQFLFTLRQKRRGEWAGILAGPATSGAITLGLAGAVVVLQEVVVTFMGVVFWGWMSLLGKEVPGYVWQAYSVLGMEVISLSIFHLALAIALPEFWAVIAMIGGYLAGHLSEHLYRASSGWMEFVWDLVYLVIPDQESIGHLTGQGQFPAYLTLLVGASTALYCAVILIISVHLMPRAAAVRPVTSVVDP